MTKYNIARLEIVDLPKGFGDFIFYPPRVSSFSVIYSGSDKVEEDHDLQRPLILHVGDVVLFKGSVPNELLELTRTNTGHGKYATVTYSEVVNTDLVLAKESMTSGKSNKSEKTEGKESSTGLSRIPVEFVGRK